MGARNLQHGDRPRRLAPSRNIVILSEELRQCQCPRLKFLSFKEFKGRGRRGSAAPVYLFMHHPPFSVGLPCVDRLGLGTDGKRLAEVVVPHANIRHLFFGHVHRPVTGSWRGIPYSTMRGTNHQVPFDFDAVEVVPKSHEQPAYAVVFLEEHQTTVHFHDYLDTYRVPYNKKSEGRPDWEYAE